MRHARAITATLGLLACADEPLAPPDTRLVFDPAAAADGFFFAAPWPSDARTTDDGRPDWSGFPDPTGIPLVATALDIAGRAQGVATSAPLYLRFDDPPDLSRLPDGAGTLEPDSPIQLVDITPSSPTFRERIPLRFEWLPQEGAYLPGNLLAVSPVPGWPLRPASTYALLVTTDISLDVPAWDELTASSGRWGEGKATVEAALPALGIDPETLAFATTLTTLDPVATLETVARFVRKRLDPVRFEPRLQAVDLEREAYDVHRSTYVTPILMQGDKPYATAGGSFAFRDDGLPLVQSWDLMRLSVVTPKSLGTAPKKGWPVLVYLHGTGGDYRTFCNSDSELEVGRWAAEMGVVGLGIDLPLHGPRGTPDTRIEIHSFNVLAPDSALHIHRQAVTDLLVLLEGLHQGVTFELPDGTRVPLDPDRIVLMGHSQGGITGALALPWIGERVQGVMLSGAGGQLAITAVERDTDFDIPGLIRDALGLLDDEPLTETHPVLGLVQSIVDPTDPINYARYWFHEDRGLTGQRPTPVLLTTGLGDLATPTRTAEALAAAAWMPLVGKRRTDAPGLVLRGLDGAALPQKDNAEGWDDTALTAGFSQWPKGDHFVVFDDPAARDLARNFVGTALNGAPRLRSGDPPEVK
ncbi:MAG: hypothetical protein H6732_20410 [Alphaproteobacteria bacterium]|nr:hypothetical protein [Alphaproteobacteria bacterium]